MDHETALSTQAAERYILGEMDDTEAQAFEEHFFGCRTCAQDVRDTSSFSENARALFLESESRESAARVAAAAAPPARASRTPSGAILVAAASLLLACALGAVAVYQSTVTIPRLARLSAPAAEEPIMLRVVRAAVPEVAVRDGQTTIILGVDVPAGAARYRCEFRSSDDETVATMDADPPESGTLGLTLPVPSFPPGDYAMTLRAIGANGATGDALEEYRFRVVKRE